MVNLKIRDLKVHGNMYTADHMSFDAATSAADMVQSIAAVQREISSLSGIPDALKVQLITALHMAAGSTPSPANADVKSRLDTAGKALEGADGLAEKTLQLAKTVFKIGQWVVAAL